MDDRSSFECVCFKDVLKYQMQVQFSLRVEIEFFRGSDYNSILKYF